MHSSQRNYSSAIGVSQPTIWAWMQYADINDPTKADPIFLFSMGELRKLGFSGPEAAYIVGQCRLEIEWLQDEPKHRRCWMIVHKGAKGQVQGLTRVHKSEALESHLANRPVAHVIALHFIIDRAREELERNQKSEAANV